MTTNGCYVLRVSKKFDLLLVLVVEGESKKYVLFDSAKKFHADSAFVEIGAEQASDLVTKKDDRGFGDIPSAPFENLDALCVWLSEKAKSTAVELEAVVRRYMQDVSTAEVLRT